MIDVVSAVVVRDGKIMAAKREPQQTFSGKWHLPGGKVEEGEELGEALIRECQEELDCKISPCELITSVKVRYPFGDYQVYFIRARIVEGEPKNVSWFDSVCIDDPWIPIDMAIALLVLALEDVKL